MSAKNTAFPVRQAGFKSPFTALTLALFLKRFQHSESSSVDGDNNGP